MLHRAAYGEVKPPKGKPSRSTKGRHYRVTVGQVGQSLGNTPGQLEAMLRRLVEDGYLRTGKELGPKQKMTTGRQLFPTGLALRTLPFYQHMTVRKVKEEIELLREE